MSKKIRAITIDPVEAALIIGGIKMLETRSRRTHVHGVVAIHSSKRKLSEKQKELAEKYGVTPQFGVVLGLVDLCACGQIKVDADCNGGVDWSVMSSQGKNFNEMVKKINIKSEEEFGDLSSGRFLWMMKVKEKFENPIPAKGRQGFWYWEA